MGDWEEELNAAELASENEASELLSEDSLFAADEEKFSLDGILDGDTELQTDTADEDLASPFVSEVDDGFSLDDVLDSQVELVDNNLTAEIADNIEDTPFVSEEEQFAPDEADTERTNEATDVWAAEFAQESEGASFDEELGVGAETMAGFEEESGVAEAAEPETEEQFAEEAVEETTEEELVSLGEDDGMIDMAEIARGEPDDSWKEDEESDPLDVVSVENGDEAEEAEEERKPIESEVDGVYDASANFVQWYEASVNGEMIELSKANLPEEVRGGEGCNVMHINVGYDTYGWLVEFADETVMSLEDVRKYQLRNGSLPADSGFVRFGQKRCAFSGVERILVYKSVRYFSYMSA